MIVSATPRSFEVKKSVQIDTSVMKPTSALSFVVPAPSLVTLPVVGEARLFPVGRVFCIGRNYPWAPEDKNAVRVMPSWFMKPATAVFHAEGKLPYPPETQDFCHEVELVVAIGMGGNHIAPEHAEKEHVWGYAVGLDLTRRDLQQAAKKNGSSWEPAKAFDFSAPCSAIVPAAQCSSPSHNAIWLSVNGSMRQQAQISDLLFSVSELVSMLSHSVKLMPGDLIFTGTPVGVGSLVTNDLIEAGIDGIGKISMRVTCSV
jgi:fumarylpyruvate hydrolase